MSALNKFYPQLNINVISTNHHSIGSYFKFKDIIPNLLASSVIYKYTCRQSSAAFIGETKNQVKVRICQHKDISPRTGIGALSIPLIVKFIPSPLKKTIPYMKNILKLLPGAQKNTSGY